MKVVPYLICAAAASLALARPAAAADTNARDFFGAPSGTNLGLFYLPHVEANRYHSDAGNVGPADLRVNALAYRQVFFTDICGTLCTPQFIVPASRITMRPPGDAQSERASGVGDPQVGGTLFFINRPEQREFSGLLTLITLPVGQYDTRNPDASAGANRWGSTFIYNYTRGIGKNWVVEGSLEAQLYGNNDDYFGATLKQKPLYRLQAFVSYDFTPATYGALRLYQSTGGALALNGGDLPNTSQRSTQLGFEVGHWLDGRNQLLLSAAKNVRSNNTFHSTLVLLRAIHVF